MGNLFHRSNGSTYPEEGREREFAIHVMTGDRIGAGTDANVWLIIHDENGQITETIKLNRKLHNDHERGTTCTFLHHPGEEFGRPRVLQIWRDSFGFGDKWYVDKIDVEDRSTNWIYHFPVHRWIQAKKPYFLREHDCCLPQEDEHLDQRRRELRKKRRIYQYVVHVEGCPAQVKFLPPDEKFSDEYKWDIVSRKGRLLLDHKLIRWTTDKWESMADLKQVYKFSLGVPACLDHWNEDKWFGLQRVQGVNPVMITLCKEIPPNFDVEPDMVTPFLEGLTLENAIDANRIFIVDLRILLDTPCKDNRTLCAPLALFFLNKNQDLMPIAIQLFQEKGPDNPVFLPSDPPYTWLLAKIYYNNADATYHQSCTHLGQTHLLMEGVVVCTHRNLSPSHPLFKLMAPHFLFLLAINTRGIEKLISPGGWVDKTMTVGRAGMFEIVKRGLQRWRMDVHGIVPNEIRSRGVDSAEILPHYPYRDDAIAIYEAIRRYVEDIICHYYDTPDKIRLDYELQQWREELVKDRALEGVGLRGVPGEENDKFTTVDEIVDTVASIISTCSLSHAAANFQQYDEYAFPPNYAGILSSDVPRDKSPKTEQDIVNRLPNKEITLDIMVITKLLSSRGTKPLGDFEAQYLYEGFCIQAAERLRADLREISKNIVLRNRTTANPYDWLNPDIIPNSISI